MKLSLKENKYLLDGKEYFIYSGEIHYFRIERNLWDKHLEKAVQAGLNSVSTYIPWSIHEPEEKKFEFGSFVEFVKEVEAAGLKLIARVGPVSNAEMVMEGLPQWIKEKYPSVYLKGKELANLPHTTLVAYNHPQFLNLVSRWYEALLPIVSQNQIIKGGCISMVQLCNEIGMVHWLNKAADYNEYSEQMYRDFLMKSFGDIKKLNKRYGSDYNDFNEISQPRGISIKEGDNLNPYYDWMQYYFQYYAKYYNKLYTDAKAQGIKVPVIANIPQFYDYDVRGRGVFSPMTTLMFSGFKDYVPEVILGGAYQMRRMDYENFHDVLLTSEVMKITGSEGIPAMCCELQTGIMRDRPKLYPSDVELNLKTSAASGLDALNGYMFSGGKNTIETGAMGTYHEWQAVVDSSGNTRPHYEVLRQFGKIIKLFGNYIAAAQKANDIAIGFYRPYYATEYLSGPFIDRLEGERNTLFFDGIARILSLAGYSYTFADIKEDSIEELLRHRVIVCISLDFMEKHTQEKLVEYARRGGRLMMYPKIPVKNLAGSTETAFSKKSGIEVETEVNEKFTYTRGLQSMVSGKVQVLNGGEKISGTDKGQCCAAVKNTGAGLILASGFGFTHVYDYLIDLVCIFMDMLDVERKVKSAPGSEVIVSMRKKDEYAFLFVANYHQLNKETWIKTKHPATAEDIKIPSNGKFTIPARSAYIIPLNIKLADNFTVIYSTAEIEGFKSYEGGFSVVLRGRGSFEGQFQCLPEPKEIKLAGNSVEYTSRGGLITVSGFLQIYSSNLEFKYEL